MDIAVSLLTVLGSLIVAVVSALVAVSKARTDAIHAVTEGYDRLCKQLQGRIDMLERELSEIRTERAAERAADRERIRLLEGRIRELEDERADLKAQLAVLFHLREGC